MGGPYTVACDVIVPVGVTLTILPGTTVFFEADTSLIVNGRLLAEGTDLATIRFTSVPGGGTWNGIQFVDSMEDNRIGHAVLEYGRTSQGMVGLERSNLLVHDTMFDHTDRRRMRSIDSSLIVRDSVFTDIFPGDMPVSPEPRSE